MTDFLDDVVGAYRRDPSLFIPEMRQLAADFIEVWQAVNTLDAIAIRDYGAVNTFFRRLTLCMFVLTGSRPRNAAFADLPYRIAHDLSLILPSDKAYSDMHGRRPVVVPTLLRYALAEAFRLRRLLVSSLDRHFDPSSFRHHGPAGTGRPHKIDTIQTRPTAASTNSIRYPWFFFLVSEQRTFQALRPITRREALSCLDPLYYDRDSEFRVQLRQFLDEAGASQAVITAVMGHNAMMRPNFGMDRWWTLRDFRDLATPYLNGYANRLGFRVAKTFQKRLQRRYG